MTSNTNFLEQEKLWVSENSESLIFPSALVFTTSFTGDEKAIYKMKEILSKIHKMNFDGVELFQLKDALPQWFLDKLTQPLSETQAQAWLKEWRSASSAKKIEMEESKGWSAENWLYWMDPRIRVTYFVGCKLHERAKYDLKIASHEFEYPSKAIDWLLKCCGLFRSQNSIKVKS